MNTDICMGCFEPMKGFSVCSHCGWHEEAVPEHVYHLYPGTILRGRYIIGNSVGVGGFGITYRAWDANLNTLVAIKEFYPAGLVSRVPGQKDIVIFSGDKREQFNTDIQRFLEEARTMAKFNGHSNIVNVFDFFEENNTAYIVMEFLDGITVKQYLESLPDNKLDVDTAHIIVNKILDAMREIHSKGVIHRDVSPDNIEMTLDNEIKIFDLGAAKLTKGDKEETRSIVVKTGYTPPEQYRAKSKQGAFTDLYSVGAVFYKLITGITPEESVDRLIEDHLERPSKLGIKIDINIEKAIMKSLALKPELRFQSATQFKDAIMNKKTVDFPEVELKKRRKKRIVFTSIISAFTVAFFSFFGVYMYNYTKGVDYLLAENEGINVYLPVSTDVNIANEQKQMYQQIADNFVKYAKEQRDNEHKVNIITVPQNEYQTTLLERMNSDMSPDVFNTDYFGATLTEYAAPLDKLLNSISSNECVIYNEYDKVYPSKCEMPTGIYANVIYANQEAARKAGIEIPTVIKNTEQLFDTAEKINDIYTVAIAEDNIDDTLSAMIDEQLYNYKNKKMAPETSEAFLKIGNSLNRQRFNYSEISPLGAFMGNQLVYYIDDTTELSNFRAYLPGYYTVLPLLNDGKLVVSMTKHMGINKNSSENKQLVGMQFISFMLTQYSQDLMHIQNKIALPLNEQSLKSYLEYNGDIAFIEDYIHDMKVIGEARLSCYNFNVTLYEDILIKNKDFLEINNYISDTY